VCECSSGIRYCTFKLFSSVRGWHSICTVNYLHFDLLCRNVAYGQSYWFNNKGICGQLLFVNFSPQWYYTYVGIHLSIGYQYRDRYTQCCGSGRIWVFCWIQIRNFSPADLRIQYWKMDSYPVFAYLNPLLTIYFKSIRVNTKLFHYVFKRANRLCMDEGFEWINLFLEVRSGSCTKPDRFNNTAYRT
jgi:hypothetical protein